MNGRSVMEKESQIIPSPWNESEESIIFVQETIGNILIIENELLINCRNLINCDGEWKKAFNYFNNEMINEILKRIHILQIIQNNNKNHYSSVEFAFNSLNEYGRTLINNKTLFLSYYLWNRIILSNKHNLIFLLEFLRNISSRLYDLQQVVQYIYNYIEQFHQLILDLKMELIRNEQLFHKEISLLRKLKNRSLLPISLGKLIVEKSYKEFDDLLMVYSIEIMICLRSALIIEYIQLYKIHKEIILVMLIYYDTLIIMDENKFEIFHIIPLNHLNQIHYSKISDKNGWFPLKLLITDGHTLLISFRKLETIYEIISLYPHIHYQQLEETNKMESILLETTNIEEISEKQLKIPKKKMQNKKRSLSHFIRQSFQIPSFSSSPCRMVLKQGCQKQKTSLRSTSFTEMFN
ncbi:hypothetical protein SNEBB_008216 [Seison nebaliae]|nr:hypothetical protein SNEBB_008216 [Seison nebaliae]